MNKKLNFAKLGQVIKAVGLAVAFVGTGLSLSASDIVGRWKTIDDETGEAKSIVNIYLEGDQAFGRIEQLFRKPTEDPDPVCEKCEGPEKNQKVKGMVIIKNMRKDGDEWVGGTILDPKKGKVYRCKLWVDPKNPDQLRVRGYLGPFFRTQTWHRVKD